jgi:hypothetical protein
MFYFSYHCRLADSHKFVAIGIDFQFIIFFTVGHFALFLFKCAASLWEVSRSEYIVIDSLDTCWFTSEPRLQSLKASITILMLCLVVV